jgi:hypothetical protein
VSVLCPTLLPRPLPPHRATPVGVYTFPVCHAEHRKPDCPLYDLAVLYGAPAGSPGHGLRNSPRSFLHLELLGGRGVPGAIGVGGLSGTRPLQRLLGTRTIGEHRGRLYFGLPYDRGGGEYGSHYTFVWRQGAWRYAASLHAWRPHRQTLAVLGAIIEHLAAQAAPAPAASGAGLHIPLPRGWHERVAYGGIGADPTGVKELIATNFRLPVSAAECEGGTPRLGRHETVVRVYDYGTGVRVPSAPSVSTLRLGDVAAQARSVRNPPAASYARMHYRGHLLVVNAAFGARHPPRGVVRQIRRILAGARYPAGHA